MIEAALTIYNSTKLFGGLASYMYHVLTFMLTYHQIPIFHHTSDSDFKAKFKGKLKDCVNNGPLGGVDLFYPWPPWMEFTHCERQQKPVEQHHASWENPLFHTISIDFDWAI